MSEEINDIQFQILDSIYFVEPLEKILEEVERPKPIVIDELRILIDKGWVQVMIFDDKKNDYQRTAIFDTDHLQDYAFLATKEGLLKHNGH